MSPNPLHKVNKKPKASLNWGTKKIQGNKENCKEYYQDTRNPAPPQLRGYLTPEVHSVERDAKHKLKTSQRPAKTS